MNPDPAAKITRFSESVVPTVRGQERFVVFHERGEDRRAGSSEDAPDALFEHVAVVVGELDSHTPVLVRIHSECLSGEVFGSLKCECGSQLQRALDRIHAAGVGVLLYLRQEGRGIGLGNKMKAYALQSQGVDTVDANTQLGLPVDARDYQAAAFMLRSLGVERVQLMTNNPAKVKALEGFGFSVERVAHGGEEHEGNESYLRAKRTRLGHIAP